MKSVDRVGRPTCTDLFTFGRHGTVDRQGRPGLRAELSVCLGRPGGRPVAANGQNLTVGRSTGPVDRQCISDFFSCQRLYFSGGYKYPIHSLFSPRIFVWIFPYSLVFSQQSKEVFELELNNLFGVFARVWKIKEKGFLGKDLAWTFSSCFLLFPKDFLCDFDFHSIGFLHTWATSTFLFYRIFVWEKELFVVVC